MATLLKDQLEPLVNDEKRASSFMHRVGSQVASRESRSMTINTLSVAKQVNESDVTVRQFVKMIIESTVFDRIIIFTILLNTLLVAMQTFKNTGISTIFYEIADLLFLSIYISEFILKFFGMGFSYFKSNYNRFDCLILIVSMIDFLQSMTGIKVVDNASALRVFRSLRALRALRSIAFIRPLQVIVSALIKTVSSLFNLILLLILLMFVFGVVGVYFWGQDNGDKENWGTLPRALLTLWTYVTADGWTYFQNELDIRGLQVARLYTVTFIFIGNFIFTNLFIAIILQNLEAAQKEEDAYQLQCRMKMIAEKKLSLQKKQELDFASLLEDVPKIRKYDKGIIDFDEKYKALEKTLQNEEARNMLHLCCNVAWLESFLTTLHFQDNLVYIGQQLSFDIANTFAELLEYDLGVSIGRPDTQKLSRRSNRRVTDVAKRLSQEINQRARKSGMYEFDNDELHFKFSTAAP